MNKIVAFLIAIYVPVMGFSQIVTTFAGDGMPGYGGDGFAATAAQISSSSGVAADIHGNVYIADDDNNVIRMVNSAGIITTVAGNILEPFGFYGGDGGQATAASLFSPQGVAVDAAGNIYIADNGNNRIRKVNTSGIITTIAGDSSQAYSGDGGQATAASLNNPMGVAVDAVGNVYIADAGNSRVRRVNMMGIISTIAGTDSVGYNGDGIPATTARLTGPTNIAIDGTGDVYIADADNNRIRKVNTAGIISTIAGTGAASFGGDGSNATMAQMNGPTGIAFDAAHNLYIADAANGRIRMINTAGIINTIAGTGAAGFGGDGFSAIGAIFNVPNDVAIDNSGNIYITDYNNHRIRRFSILAEGVPGRVHSGNYISIYPNPCNGDFYINISSQVQEDASIAITNSTGQVVKEIRLPTNQQAAINMDEPSGTYLLHTTTGSGSSTEKIVLVK